MNLLSSPLQVKPASVGACRARALRSQSFASPFWYRSLLQSR